MDEVDRPSDSDTKTVFIQIILMSLLDTAHIYFSM
jgi:hypothetical protein